MDRVTTCASGPPGVDSQMQNMLLRECGAALVDEFLAIPSDLLYVAMTVTGRKAAGGTADGFHARIVSDLAAEIHKAKEFGKQLHVACAGARGTRTNSVIF